MQAMERQGLLVNACRALWYSARMNLAVDGAREPTRVCLLIPDDEEQEDLFLSPVHRRYHGERVARIHIARGREKRAKLK